MIHNLFCALGRCLACTTKDDDTGIWGECIRCGKRHGFVSRAELRAYCDHIPKRAALDKAVGCIRCGEWLDVQ